MCAKCFGANGFSLTNICVKKSNHDGWYSLIRWKWKIGWNVVTKNHHQMKSWRLWWQWLIYITNGWNLNELMKNYLCQLGFTNHGHQFVGWPIVDTHWVLGFIGGRRPPTFSSIFHLCACFEFQAMWFKSNVGGPLVAQC
jgi:hypothetical protein